MEKYSFLVSLYCRESPEFLKDSILSMIEQTCRPDEIVIVKDGLLTDELDAVLNDFDSRYPGIFNIVGYEENQGLGYALNYGLKYCRNELIARMDTDDISKPERCIKQLEYFELHPETDIVGGQIDEFIGEVDNIIGRRTVPETDAEIKKYMKERCPLNHVTVMFKKTSVINAGGYMSLLWNEDYYLWVRLSLNECVFANIPDVLVDVRINDDTYRRRGGMRYFKSEAAIQRIMLDNKMINRSEYCLNMGKRFVVQVLLPNKIRGWVFKKLARERVPKKVNY